MEPTPSPNPLPPTPSQPPPALQTAWPRSAQLATAFLLGLATALLLTHLVGQLRWGSQPTELTYRVDLNRANHAELLQLPGVGDALAERIEGYRQEHGDFQSVEELANVHGIGPATLEKLRPCVYVRRDETREAAPGLEPDRLTRKSRPTLTRKPAGGKAVSKKGASLDRPVDINRATEGELMRVPGVGPVLARKIVEERGKKAFLAVEELCRVPGIKQRKLEQLRPYVTVGRNGEEDGSQVRAGQQLPAGRGPVPGD